MLCHSEQRCALSLLHLLFLLYFQRLGTLQSLLSQEQGKGETVWVCRPDVVGRTGYYLVLSRYQELRGHHQLVWEGCGSIVEPRVEVRAGPGRGEFRAIGQPWPRVVGTGRVVVSPLKVYRVEYGAVKCGDLVEDGIGIVQGPDSPGVGGT